jgi:LmbE family N-acetylglucosaminyl deacetylase
MRARVQLEVGLASHALAGLLRNGSSAAITLVVAHPDDETLALGGHLAHLPAARVVHVTGGVPRDPAFAERAGFGSPDAYAEAREGELARALAVLQIPSERRRALGGVDQAVVYDLPNVVQALAAEFRAHPPTLIITHVLEGGHPDHDATSVAVRAAWHRVRRELPRVPVLAEFPLYRQRPHSERPNALYQEFIPHPGAPVLERSLAFEARRRKATALACHRSQADVLAAFPLAVERFRRAVTVDYASPPHSGPLYYELMGWHSGAEFRARVERTLGQFGLSTWLVASEWEP